MSEYLKKIIDTIDASTNKPSDNKDQKSQNAFMIGKLVISNNTIHIHTPEATEPTKQPDRRPRRKQTG